jgi:hypothetical protein
MRLVGDPDGIAALEELVGDQRDYLRAQSSISAIHRSRSRRNWRPS